MQLRTKVFYGLTACFAIACFSLVIYALSTAVDFFSGLFSLTDEETARKYLKDNFSSVMGTLYLSIFGMVIVTADTVVLFIKFISRGKLLFLHIFFFLSILICGIVALAGSTQFATELSSQNCSEFECNLSSSYLTYIAQLQIFFICFCIFFVGFGVFFQLAIVFQASQQQQTDQDKQIKSKRSSRSSKKEEAKIPTLQESVAHNSKNVSFISEIQ